MTGRLRACGYALRRAIGGLGRRPRATAFAVASIAAGVSLAALVHLAAYNVSAVTARVGGGVQMIVYLDDGVTADRARAIEAALQRLPAVRGTRLVPPEVAYERLRESLGPQASVLDDIEASLLPASIEVELRDGVSDVAAIAPAVDKLRAAPGVESVDVFDDWTARLSALAGALRLTASLLAVVVALVCSYIVWFTVGQSLRQRKHEMRVAALLGGTGAFVRGPMVVEGALQGAIGAALAAVGVYALFAFGADPIAAGLRTALGDVTLGFFPVRDAVAIVGAAGALGALAAWVASRRWRALA
ncbi:MAG: FtsX-like permease family protein [Deltaproteobacteria bacterium]|nr:MAG: FtsX-like permease family protein [Deltaproteobacteria bacterium]